MPYDRFVRTGLFGAVITAICCFTPLLVGALTAAGMAAAIAWLDIILLPLLGLFLGMLFFGLAGKAREKAREAETSRADSSNSSDN